MTVTIAPIAAIGGALPALPALPTMPTGTAPAAGPGSFSEMMVGALEDLQGSHAQADALAEVAATGDLTDIHDYMIAATEASLATELTVAVRNKAVEAFNSIMSMPI